MARVKALAYVVLGTTDIGNWEDFCRSIVAAETVVDRNGVLRVRFDERAWRWELRRKDREELIAIGWDVGSESDLDEFVRKHGAVPASTAECEARGVRRMARLTDPCGTVHEIIMGAACKSTPLSTSRNTRFVTGVQGLGHVVLYAEDVDAALSFAIGTLGLRLTDTIRRLDRTVYFLRCNARHHSLAVIAGSGSRLLNHLMVQVTELDDVGFASALADERGIVTRTLGRHTNDRMLSFYCRTPSGFELEYGCNAISVNEDSWIPVEHPASSIWGHKRK